MKERVRVWLGVPPGATDSLDRLAAAGPPPGGLKLPAADDAAELLGRLRVPPVAIDEIVGAMPSEANDPEAWWLLERAYNTVVDRELPEFQPPWPGPWPGDDALSRYFHLYVFMAAVPDLLALHGDRGIPDDITWATLEDVGLQVMHHEAEHGRPGFNGAFWIWHHFRGTLYRLGRLHFEPTWRQGDPEIALHIPAVGPLTPEACDDAIDRARGFFARHFSENHYRVATCNSWLLDDQLAEYLPAASNILQFQRRFTPTDVTRAGNDDIVRFVFGRVPGSLDELPQRTTLERAVVGHLKAGRPWWIRLGWFEL